MNALLRAFAVAAACWPGAAAQRPPTPTQRCEGRVVDVRGEPVPAAKVWVRTALASDHVAAVSHTDGDGRFVLARVPADEELILEASADGYAVARIEPIAAAPWWPITMVESVPVHGRLVDRAGRPVANVAVVAATAGGPAAWDTATTDAEGRFHLRSAPIGTVWTTAIVPREGIAGLRANFPPPGAIGLAPAPRTAFDASVVVHGLPAGLHAPRTCAFRPTGGDMWLFPPPWATVGLDAGGMCELGSLVDLAIEVTPRLRGFVAAPLVATLTRDKPRVEFTAIAADAPELLLHGQVLDDGGVACANLELTLLVQGRGLRATAVTNGEGRFRLRLPCAPGTEVTIRCTRGDHALAVDHRTSRPGVPHDPLAAWRGPVQTAQPLQLLAERAATLRGRVLLANGSPAAGAEVAVYYERQMAGNWERAQRAVTDVHGAFELQALLPGVEPLRLLVSAPGGRGDFDVPAIESAGVRTLPDLRLREAATVTGEVLDHAGAPMPGAEVTIAAADKSSARVFTDRRGRFRCAQVAPGEVRVAVQQGPRQAADSATFEIAAGQARAVTLRVVEPPR